MVFIFFSITVLLAIITFQDFKFRAVNWVLFPLLFISLFIFISGQVGLALLFDRVALNMAFSLMFLMAMFIYFWAKTKNITAFLGMFGLGDLLLIPAFCLVFTLYSYIIYLILSNLVILLCYLIVYKKKITQITIPFAGCHAVFLSVILSLEYSKVFSFNKFVSELLIQYI